MNARQDDCYVVGLLVELGYCLPRIILGHTFREVRDGLKQTITEYVTSCPMDHGTKELLGDFNCEVCGGLNTWTPPMDFWILEIPKADYRKFRGQLQEPGRERGGLPAGYRRTAVIESWSAAPGCCLTVLENGELG